MLAQQQAPQEVHGDGNRPVAHVTPSAGHLGAARDLTLAIADRDADQSDGLVRAATTGAGDPGDPDPDLGAEARGDPLCKRLGDLDRNRPEAFDQRRIDAGDVDLGLV